MIRHYLLTLFVLLGITSIEAQTSSPQSFRYQAVVRNVSGEVDDVALLHDGANDSLRFSELKPTSSKEDPNPLPGLRRLG